MTTYPMHYTDNAHSLRRIRMLAHLYWPSLRPGFVICAAVPALVVFLSALISTYTGRLPVPVIRWPIILLIYLSPLMLIRRDYRCVSSQLPVTAFEKLCFLCLTFWIAVPAVIVLGIMVGELLSIGFFGTRVETLFDTFKEAQITDASAMGVSSTALIFIISWLESIAMVTIVMYYVVTTKKNRFLAAFLSLFIAYVSIMFICAITGVVIGIAVGIEASVAGAPDPDMAGIVKQVSVWILGSAVGSLMIAAFIYLIKLYKRLRNSGF